MICSLFHQSHISFSVLTNQIIQHFLACLGFWVLIYHFHYFPSKKTLRHWQSSFSTTAVSSPQNHVQFNPFPADIDLLNVNNRNTKIRCKICSKSTTKTSEQRQWHCWLWTYFTTCSTVSIVNFEHVITGWFLPNATFIYPLKH